VTITISKEDREALEEKCAQRDSRPVDHILHVAIQQYIKRRKL
jgi:hypothetical protein